jgi:hypothetical protein
MADGCPNPELPQCLHDQCLSVQRIGQFQAIPNDLNGSLLQVFLIGVDNGVEQVLSSAILALPLCLVHVHLEFEGHGQHCPTILQLPHKLLANIPALLPLLTRGILLLLITDSLGTFSWLLPGSLH